MIYLKTFKLSESKNKNTNIYPFNVLQNKEPDIFIFDNITVLCHWGRRGPHQELLEKSQIYQLLYNTE